MNTDTKRHIDAARQVLVGVVPNPTSQIDQITNALIYKFMDDMDQAAIKAGGKPSFFVKDLEKYSWMRLMDARIGNQERMNIYTEALTKLSESKQLPELFRSIFKSAFLPYRSPEVLGLFLKEINYFDYSHPEELGNAYEYLLSVMGSQGDAGQFRTPRHIIDFIVKVVNPAKDDKVLDPACGTGGFLVKSYEHILEQHDGKDDPNKKEKPLTPDDRKKMMNNFEGYDIDPGMVRIAKVNMYLHQFKNPQINQYDSLGMDERWGDKFDVIMANPPFMSPRGGVMPHNKFSIQSSRSEVLFVDYIMNHLRPNGRAGVIVPEGIIFQSGIAYKQLRKNLIEDGLYAVISLPSGVFQPYSGVKTSILFFDNEIAKKTKYILFAKVNNDGFSLGSQRREIQEDDLPEIIELINKFKDIIVQGKDPGAMSDLVGTPLATQIDKDKIKEDNDFPLSHAHNIVSIVQRQTIIETGDYNLSGDRYRVATDYSNAKWPMVELGEVMMSKSGNGKIKGKLITENNGSLFPAFSATGQDVFSDTYDYEGLGIVISAVGARCGKCFLANGKWSAIANTHVLLTKSDRVSSKYIFLIVNDENFWIRGGVAQPFVKVGDSLKKKIPLPPLEIQEQIVAELDGYQKIIDGAKQIVSSYNPTIKVYPDWKHIKLEELTLSLTPPKKIQKNKYQVIGKYPIIDQSQKEIAGFTDDKATLVDVGQGVVIFGDHTCSIKYSETPFAQGADGIKILATKKICLPKYLFYFLKTNPVETEGYKRHFGKLKSISISVPPVETQKQIVAKIEEEQKMIEANKGLVKIFEQKIKDKISEIWGE